MKLRLFQLIVGPLLAIALGSLVILLAKANPIAAYEALFRGAMGSVQGLSETLTQTTLFIFAGLSVALAFRAGLFNIGAEGQLVVGALCAAVVGADVHVAKILEIPVCFAAGAVGGGLWGFIAGFLRARFGASEVITTIMLNYVAYLGANYLVAGPLRGSQLAPETSTIDAAAMLNPIVPGTRLTAAFPLAIVVAVVAWWWLQRTVAGFELRTVGRSERVARYAGISAQSVIIKTMMLSGALAGIGGASEVMGLLHRFNAQLSPGYGFTSIAVALLAQSNPLGVIASGFFFGVLSNGALSMQAQALVPKDLVSIIEGLIILFASASWMGSHFALHGARGREPSDAGDKPIATGPT